MAATTITTRPLTPAEIAQATATAIPSEFSTRPLLGILGVLIGAHLVTLTGRMLSLGLADLKGHVGIGFDEGAWLDSAYNAALMFIGPFSVYRRRFTRPTARPSVCGWNIHRDLRLPAAHTQL